jgi:hypothetical protein
MPLGQNPVRGGSPGKWSLQGRWKKGEDPPLGAVRGVLSTVLRMIEGGVTHVGVATDNVIESFRNPLWPGYKTGAGVERSLLAHFQPLEDAPAAMGVPVWPMVELEADDALASAACLALLFKDLATLRTNDLLFTTVDELEWRGPAGGFAAWAERIGDAGLRRVAGNARRPVLGQDQG